MSVAALQSEIERAGGRVFIGFKESESVSGVNSHGQRIVSAATIEQTKEELRREGVEIRREYGRVPAVAATISPNMIVNLLDNSRVEYVEPVFPSMVAAPSSRSAGFRSQSTPWNVTKVQAPTAWSRGTGSGVDLLIIDTGADSDHPDLDYYDIHDCYEEEGDGEDGFGHGTFVAGVAAAADNSSQIVGVAPDVNLWSVKVGQNDTLDTEAIPCALEYAIDNEVFVVNMSFSGPYYSPSSQLMAEAVDVHGMLLVASAGNTYGGSITWPAENADVMAVTAVDEDDDRWIGSPIDYEIDIAAPGADITSTCLGGGTCKFDGHGDGTSFAAPHAAAAGAILKEYNSYWDGGDIRWRLETSAIEVSPLNYFGNGLLKSWYATGGSTMYATIYGPSSVSAMASCQWEASVSGGAPPYSYSWSGVLSGSGGTVSGSVTSSGYLYLTATDVFNQPKYASKYITVDMGPPSCG
jgi:subtilisin